MYGSDHFYGDIERACGMLSTERPVQTADTKLDGHPVAVLKPQATEESGSRYAAVIAGFSRQDRVIRQVDVHEPDKQPVADASSIPAAGNSRLPQAFTMRDLTSATGPASASRRLKATPPDDPAFDPGHPKDFRGIQ